MKKRTLWIDCLRIIGMLGVIIMHIVGNTINTLGLKGTPEVIYDIVSKSFYFTMPLFVMISGGLLLSKDINYKDIFFKYIRRMVFVLIIFGGAFAFMEEYFLTKTIELSMIGSIIKRIFTGDLWAHMWYIYLMIALYLITPLLRKWVKHSNNNEQLWFLIILYILTILSGEFCGLIGIQTAFYIPINTGFVFTYLLGYYIFNNDLSKKKETILYIFSILSIIGIILLSYFKVCNYLVGYTSTLCIIVAIGVLYILKNRTITKKKIISNLIRMLGECSFGIYIIHQFYINIIYKFLKMDFILTMPYLGILIYVFIVFILSLSTIYILKKIKFMNKYIL